MPSAETTSALKHVSDTSLAGLLATAAGRMLLDLRSSSSLTAARLRTEGDLRSHQLLLEQLGTHRAADHVLSEEGDDDGGRLTADRVWIVDPLDGTREYAEGRDDWAVHVALWRRGELVAGAVALPALGFTATSDDDLTLGPDGAEVLRLAVSRTRPPPIVARLAELLPVELVPMGSAGYKALAVVRGEVDAYVHAGGQYEWDSAAPVAVARAAGAVATRLDGSALRYNEPDPMLPDLVIAHPGRALALRSAIDIALGEGE